MCSTYDPSRLHLPTSPLVLTHHPCEPQQKLFPKVVLYGEEDVENKNCRNKIEAKEREGKNMGEKRLLGREVEERGGRGGREVMVSPGL